MPPETSSEPLQFSLRTEDRAKQSLYLERAWGITITNYREMFDKQEGKCAICGTHQRDLKSRLAVDHDHYTNEIRGLLCNRCNPAIGLLEDDVERLEAAIAYLKNPPALEFGLEAARRSVAVLPDCRIAPELRPESNDDRLRRIGLLKD